MNKKTIDAIRKFFEEMNDDDFISIVSELNSYNGNLESYQWYPMDELDELTGGMSHWEVLRLAYYGEFNPNDNYFHFDGYGNLESTDYPTEDIDNNDIDDIIDEIDNIPYQYLPDDIQNIISEHEFDDDDDEEEEAEEAEE